MTRITFIDPLSRIVLINMLVGRNEVNRSGHVMLTFNTESRCGVGCAKMDGCVMVKIVWSAVVVVAGADVGNRRLKMGGKISVTKS